MRGGGRRGAQGGGDRCRSLGGGIGTAPKRIIAAHTPAAHRSHPSPTKLQLDTCTRRHGARTPLTHEPALMLDREWTAADCGAAYPGGARLSLTGADGAPPPPHPGDQKQRACVLPGGACHKGELTRLGQQQVRGS